MRLQSLTGKFPTERPPDPDNGSPGTVGTVTGAEIQTTVLPEQLQDTATGTHPSSPLPSLLVTAKISPNTTASTTPVTLPHAPQR